MASCRLSSAILKVAAAFLLIALLLHVVGTATPHWHSIDQLGPVYDSFDEGLWQSCFCKSKVDCTCSEKSMSGAPDWYKATQALVIIGLIALLASVIITCVLLCTRQRRGIKLINIIILALAGIFILIAVIIYGVKMDEVMDLVSSFKFDYSYILCVIAACLILLVCLPLLIWDYCVTPRRRRDDRIRYTTRKSEIFVQPEERYVAPAPVHGSHPAYGYYEPSYEPVQYGRQPEYVAPYTTYSESRPAYTDYRASRPAYIDYRSSRPDYISSSRPEYISSSRPEYISSSRPDYVSSRPMEYSYRR